MNLYIDCEWNGYQGDLISMALIPQFGDYFYGVLACLDPLPWVADNVMPVLKYGVQDLFDDEIALSRGLAKYLSQFDSIHIIADWPEDIERFCRALIVGPGLRIDTPPLSFEVLRIDAQSEIPHNALFDAHALRIACLERADK